jgi:hypothetical protein
MRELRHADENEEAAELRGSAVASLFGDAGA